MALGKPSMPLFTHLHNVDIYIVYMCIHLLYPFDIVAFITNTKLQTKMKISSQYTEK